VRAREPFKSLQTMADVLLMGLLVIAVMMVSGGLAVVARCIEASNGPFWAVPSLAFFFGVTIACAGTFVFARTVTRRSRTGLTATAVAAYGTYSSWPVYASSNDAGHLGGDRGRQRDDVLGFALNRDQVKEAARMILFEGQEELQRVARARRAGRSACRRGHARRLIAPPEPKRRRVRPRPRLFM
jgi:hypothetical protein